MLAAGCVLFCGLWLTVSPPDAEARGVQTALGIVAVGGAVLALRFPLTAIAITVAATGTGWVLGLTADPFVLAGFAVFAFAERRGVRRIPWWVPFGGLIVLVGALGLSSEGMEDRFRGVLLGGVILSAAWFLGVRTRQVAEASAERSRVEERLRLARDVHDVLSHSLGALGVRAGVAAHVTALNESDLRDVLREMEEDARASLLELKTLLQRERGTAAGDDDALPSLSLEGGLAEFTRHAERAGLEVRSDVPEALDDLPAVVRTTLYRVVQEAATNTLRHAAAGSLTIAIAISASRDECRVEVRDDGVGAAPGFREGHGLTGMRERVEALGGTLSAGNASPGFATTARLPLPTPAPRNRP